MVCPLCQQPDAHDPHRQCWEPFLAAGAEVEWLAEDWDTAPQLPFLSDLQELFVVFGRSQDRLVPFMGPTPTGELDPAWWEPYAGSYRLLPFYLEHTQAWWAWLRYIGDGYRNVPMSQDSFVSWRRLQNERYIEEEEEEENIEEIGDIEDEQELYLDPFPSLPPLLQEWGAWLTDLSGRIADSPGALTFTIPERPDTPELPHEPMRPSPGSIITWGEQHREIWVPLSHLAAPRQALFYTVGDAGRDQPHIMLDHATGIYRITVPPEREGQIPLPAAFSNFDAQMQHRFPWDYLVAQWASLDRSESNPGSWVAVVPQEWVGECPYPVEHRVLSDSHYPPPKGILAWWVWGFSPLKFVFAQERWQLDRVPLMQLPSTESLWFDSYATFQSQEWVRRIRPWWSLITASIVLVTPNQIEGVLSPPLRQMWSLWRDELGTPIDIIV